MKKLKAVVFATLFASGIAQASLTQINAVPTTWKLENYSGSSSVVLWYTGSSCANGQLVLPTAATVADHNRLFSTVQSAKVTGKQMFVIYETADCTITSFGLL